jgi:hypothetical protein
MIERRRAPRHPTSGSASIAFNRRHVRLCTVRDISTTGACLQLLTMTNVPDTFNLIRDGEAHTCRVTWRSMDHLGVRFNLFH